MNIEQSTFLIIYMNATGNDVGELVTTQSSHWDACRFGWDNIPHGAEDFQVYAEEEHVRLTGVALTAH